MAASTGTGGASSPASPDMPEVLLFMQLLWEWAEGLP